VAAAQGEAGQVRARGWGAQGLKPSLYRGGVAAPSVPSTPTEGGSGLAREAKGGRWAWPGPWLGGNGLGRAHGLGTIR
jgi:hypothetical protein